MSYGLRLVADARAALATLPLAVEEQAWDVLDGIAAEADRLKPEPIKVQHLVYRTDREVVYVDLYCTALHDERTIVLDRLVAIIAPRRVN